MSRVTSTSIWTYACGAMSARDIWAAMPLRICVIGTRTSSVPSGKVTVAPVGAAARETGAGAAGDGAGAGEGRELCCAGVAWGRRGELCGGGCGRLPAGADRLDDREHVVTGDPSTTASADDLLGTEAVLSEEAADGGRHPCIRVAVCSWSGRRGGGRSGSGGGCRGRSGGCRRR